MSIGGLIALFCAIITILISLAAYFPEEFEARGIYMFHNSEGGVFADCFSDKGKNIPACSKQFKENLTKHLLDSKPDAKEIRKPRIVPFTFEDS